MCRGIALPNGRSWSVGSSALHLCCPVVPRIRLLASDAATVEPFGSRAIKVRGQCSAERFRNKSEPAAIRIHDSGHD